MGIADDRIRDFTDKVATKSPTPGGGAVAAVTAAMATGLVEMVASLTIGKKKYEDYEGEMERILSEASYRRKRFYELAEEDMKAFDGVMEAMKLPKYTDEEKRSRTEKLQESLKKASEVPYELAREISKICPLAEKVFKYGNKNAFSDAKSAVHLLSAAFESAISNVEINLELIKDETFTSKMTEALVILRGTVDKCLSSCKK